MKTLEELKRSLYHVDGSFRDVYILQASREEWCKWIDFVNRQYPIRWYTEGQHDHTTIDTRFIEQRWDLETKQLPTTASIFLEQVRVNCHFFIDTEIENDIDPKEVQSIEDHERILAYLIKVSYVRLLAVNTASEKEKRGVRFVHYGAFELV